jgi:hypothetical protein
MTWMPIWRVEDGKGGTDCLAFKAKSILGSFDTWVKSDSGNVSSASIVWQAYLFDQRSNAINY